MKDRNLFHWVDTIGNILTSGAATCENITDGVHSMKWISIFHRKKKQISPMYLLPTGSKELEMQYARMESYPKNLKSIF